VDFDYVFTGEPSDAVFHIDLTLQTRPDTVPPRIFHGPAVRRPEPGAHHLATSFDYPSEGTSTQFIISMTNGGFGVTTLSPNVKVLATQRVDQVITWPTWEERNLHLARDMISSNSDENILKARQMLEQLVAKNPKLEPAFVELARVAMKTNWGPEGLHQAETLLDSALQIRPESVDAKILLGYVYTHQQRFQKAEALFVDAARSNPSNVWLWTNWGELLEMQGHTDQAIEKYREALEHPTTVASGEARLAAYQYLVKLLKARKDFDGVEAVYKRRISEFGAGSCFSVDYARFELNVRGNPQAAIDLARGALSLNCEDAPSREVLGLASYVLWAQRSGPESVEALNQARIYVPAGPKALYLLASNDSTMAAARKLLGTGESIDQKDNEEMSALGYALESSEVETTERLLQLGARPDTPVGPDSMPVAFLPVLEGNVEEIRVLRRAGVNFSKLRYRGTTALDIAKRSGNDKLIEELTHNGSTL
jgi:tetratricopeptide (TPR) repeat protein